MYVYIYIYIYLMVVESSYLLVIKHGNGKLNLYRWLSHRNLHLPQGMFSPCCYTVNTR